jgi:hypothetical protein
MSLLGEEEISRGNTVNIIRSDILGNERRAWAYTPPGNQFDDDRSYVDKNKSGLPRN